MIADPAGARKAGEAKGLSSGLAAGEEIATGNAETTADMQTMLHKDQVASLGAQLRAARKEAAARYKAGASDALGEFGQPWQAGQSYIVTTKTSPDYGVGIATRGTIDPGTLYLLCGSSPTDVCTRPDPAY